MSHVSSKYVIEIITQQSNLEKKSTFCGRKKVNLSGQCSPASVPAYIKWFRPVRQWKPQHICIISDFSQHTASWHSTV